jgi:hypothetical protein
VVRRLPSEFGNLMYNAAAVGPDNRVWGLAATGVFEIDTLTNEVEMTGKAPLPISGGFALIGRSLYLICGPSVYRYQLPLLH